MNAVANLIDGIQSIVYPIAGGRDGFLADPGGWIDLALNEADDETAARAIELIESGLV